MLLGTSIAPAIPICLRLFDDTAEALRGSERQDAPPFEQALVDQRGRFKIWGSNIGAHLLGRGSLDYRLRDASHLKTRVIRYLGDLTVQLSDVTAIITGVRPGLEEGVSDSDSDSGSGSDGSADSPKPTELAQLFHDIEQIITCLFRISMTIRNPTPHDRYVKAEDSDASHFEPYDIEHVKQRYPNAPDYLIERIGKSISRRRQYFKYRQLHAAKLKHDFESDDADDSATLLSETTASTFEGIATPGRRSIVSDRASIISDFSETSYATSISSVSGTAARMPPMPKSAEGSQHFECPYCYGIEAVEDTQAWRKHVYKDLEPYICTFETCSNPEKLYDRRRHWFNHECQMHRSLWTCNGHCDATFVTEDEMIGHMKIVYPDANMNKQALVVLSSSSKKTDKDLTASCPFCSESMAGLVRIQKHVAHHLAELALFALPNETDDDDDDVGSLSSRSFASSDSGTPTNDQTPLEEMIFLPPYDLEPTPLTDTDNSDLRRSEIPPQESLMEANEGSPSPNSGKRGDIVFTRGKEDTVVRYKGKIFARISTQLGSEETSIRADMVDQRALRKLGIRYKSEVSR